MWIFLNNLKQASQPTQASQASQPSQFPTQSSQQLSQTYYDLDYDVQSQASTSMLSQVDTNLKDGGAGGDMDDESSETNILPEHACAYELSHRLYYLAVYLNIFRIFILTNI